MNIIIQFITITRIGANPCVSGFKRLAEYLEMLLSLTPEPTILGDVSVRRTLKNTLKNTHKLKKTPIVLCFSECPGFPSLNLWCKFLPKCQWPLFSQTSLVKACKNMLIFL